MRSAPCAIRRSGRGIVRSAALALVGASALLGPSGASAQVSASCADVQKFLVQRKALTDKLTAASKGKKIDAGFACSNFTQLVSNGQSLIKWIDANKDWCQIPDTFAQGIKADHGKAISIRAQACKVASQQVEMQKRAKEGGGGGLLGGNGLEGQSKMPQGAL